MRPIRETCTLRPEVLQGDLTDAIFAADFGHVIEGHAADVYQQPTQFFRNTYPTERLKKVVTTIFGRLASPNDAGAVLRLSTGFGGGKTHTLIALWHLARHIGQTTLGTELLPAAGRPGQVVVAGIDASKFGKPVCATHPDLKTYSLHGELAYQLGGQAGYAKVADIDKPELRPDATAVRSLLPDAPVLILIDELVIHMAALDDQEKGGLLAFINTLMAEVGARKQAVVVITDPADQAAYRREAGALAKAVDTEAAQALDDVLGRRSSDQDTIGKEAAQVINRRLFERVDGGAADEASAEYYNAYQRIANAYPDLLPGEVATTEYAGRIKTSYPFHPRLLETARDRLGALQDFNQSRGVLRLFARILRDVWESKSDIAFVSGGDLDWQSERMQADLLQRLNRDNFMAAVTADVVNHAGRLDADYSTDIHRRVASALLLESLPMTDSAVMSKRDLSLAVLCPGDVGNEASDALDRLMAVCWHLYKDDSGLRFQFRFEPNANRIIEERTHTIPMADARQRVLALVQNYFTGHTFSLNAYPGSPKAVPDSAALKLVLCDDEELAHAVCEYEDNSDPVAKRPRRFRNAIFAVAPTTAALGRAVDAMRRLLAAEQVAKEHKKGTPVRSQVDDMLPQLHKRAQLAAVRAFDRVVLQGRPSLPLDEKYLVSQEGALNGTKGQTRLKDFLDDKQLVYQPTDALDVGLLLQLVQGATPSLDHPGAYLASAVHERALASDKLRLLLNEEPVRRAALRAVEQGQLVVRQPNSDVFDDNGCVTGPPGNRQRHASQRLAVLKLTADVLLAEPAAECVAAWLKTDEPTGAENLLTLEEAAAQKHVSAAQMADAADAGQVDYTVQDGLKLVKANERFAAWRPQQPGQVSVFTWDSAIAHAARRPLLALKLRTKDAAVADKLIACAQPFGAQQLVLSVMAGGSLKEGGTVKFAVNNVKHNSPIKPIDTARRLLQVASEDATLAAELSLDFGSGPAPNAEARLGQARQQAGGAAVEIEATFGPEETQ